MHAIDRCSHGVLLASMLYVTCARVCVAICDTSDIRVVPLYASLIHLVVGAVETEGQHTNNAAMSRWDSGSSS